MATRAGVIGLGLMGSGIAASIARAGLPLTVYDIRPEAVAAVFDSLLDSPGESGESTGESADSGESVAESVNSRESAGDSVRRVRGALSPADVAAVADVICVVVFDQHQVEDVLFGTDGIATAARPGTVVCVCSTVDADSVPQLAARAEPLGIAVVDAGVAGGSPSAHTGTLVTTVGGDVAVIDTARPVLDAFSKEVIHAGPLGAGMNLKLIKNLLSYLALCAAHETLLLAETLGVDAATVRHLTESSDLVDQFFWFPFSRPTNFRLDATAPADQRERAGFFSELARKDLRSIEALAATVGLDLPAARTAREQADRYFLAPETPGTPDTRETL
jgi:3-hydroxyisobutyrate dehydrogenase-like beta-hydroxyacid dehydrogenase